MTDINGDLFKRRLLRRLFSLCLTILTAVASPHSGASAQSDVLARTIVIDEEWKGSKEELIEKLQSLTGISVAYSSRVLLPGNAAIGRGHHTVGECLNIIFNRLSTRYVATGNKIVVALDDGGLKTLSGYCRDAQTGEMLIGAHASDTVMRRVTATNGYGFFSLRLPAGEIPLRLSYVGYNAVTRTIELTRDTIVEIRLQPRLMLGTVDVQASDEEEMSRNGMGGASYSKKELQALPALLGETDLTRALLHTPGIQSGNEGYGGMSVRGGSQDQNMVYLDDAPLYNPTHMLGFFSVFNSDAINRAHIIKSGFPARYGGRMSSVLDIKTIDGNMDHFQGRANIGLLSSSALLQGPLRQNKASYIFSARRTYFDIFSNYLQRNSSNSYSYYFYDLHGKINWHPSQRDRIYMSLFYGVDRLGNSTNSEEIDIDYGDKETRRITLNDNNYARWGSLLASARWNHVFSPNLFGNATAWYSFYRFGNVQSTRDRSYDGRRANIVNEYRNGIHDAGLRIDLNIRPPHDIGFLRAGLWGNYKHYQPFIGINTAIADSANSDMRRDVSLPSWEIHAYAEHSMRHGRFFSTTGLHLSAMPRRDAHTYFEVEPRLIVGFKIAPSLTLRANYSLTTQSVYQARMLSVATPADMWMPLGKNVRPQKTSQTAVELRWKIMQHLVLTAEAYYKNMPQLLTYQEISPFEMMNSQKWDDLSASGRGYAKGVEFFLQRRRGRLTGWAGYAISMSRNKFRGINEEEYYASDFDRLHSVQLFLSCRLTDDVDISATWNYGTGVPVTLSTQRYSIAGSNVDYVIPTKRNAWRMPDSHQLNFGVNIRFGETRRGSILSFGVYNAYAHRNPSFIYWKEKENNEKAKTQYSLKEFCFISFPWPYLKYAIDF